MKPGSAIVDHDAILRFWQYVQIAGEDDCWLWLAGCNQGGYGQLNCKDRVFNVARVSYWLHTDDDPVGYFVLHTCDNPPCVNPRHLFLGDQLANMADCKSKGRKAEQNGRNNGETASSAKFTNVEVQDLRFRNAMGISTRELATEKKVHISTIWAICSGLYYKGV